MNDSTVVGAFLGRCLPRLTSLLFIEFSCDGVLVGCNPGLVTVIGSDPVGKRFAEVFVDFTDAFHPARAAEHPDEAFTLHLKTDSGLPQSFRFHFERLGERILCLGEADSQEISSLRHEMIAINHEVNNLARDLMKKNAELGKLDETKNRFLGMAAHDLRNPISIILCYCDLLVEDLGPQLNEERQTFLAHIRRSGEFMMSLLNNLLDITQIEAGKLELHLQATALSELVESNLVLNRRIAKKKEIKIISQTRGELPKVSLDRDRIRQVLDNLLSNAIKFSPHGSTISVEIFRSGEHASVAVRDSGPGISQEHLNRLFLPFSRVGSKPTGGETSTGLGLVIARKIVTEHRGKMSVKTAVGEGSTFTFNLPLDSPSANSS